VAVRRAGDGVETFVLLDATRADAESEANAAIRAEGGRVVQAYPGALIALLPAGGGGEPPTGAIETFPGAIPDIAIGALPQPARIAAHAWNLRHTADYAARKANRPGEGARWDEGPNDHDGGTAP
jgi:hypothetical protein